jgi:DNA-binding transcriptional LysR family regulator
MNDTVCRVCSITFAGAAPHAIAQKAQLALEPGLDVGGEVFMVVGRGPRGRAVHRPVDTLACPVHLGALIPFWNTGSVQVTDVGAEPLSGRELAAFVAAVDAGSMGAAAEFLSLTQSAATKRVQRLERRLGTVLLSRSGRGVRPTDAGLRLYPHAREALAALIRAEHTVGEDATRRLRLAASHTVAEYLLPQWLAGFRLVDSGARPQVAFTNSPGVLSALRAGDAEVGFVAGVDPLHDFHVVTVAHDRLMVVVAPHHRWAHSHTINPAELVDEPYFTREPHSGTRAVATAALSAVGLHLQPQLEAGSTHSLKRAVMDGGFTILSSLAIAAERRAGTLHALTVAGADMTRDLEAVALRSHQLRGRALAFWRWLADRADMLNVS